MTEFIKPIRHTFEMVKKESWFKDIIKELKKEGWLDWHLIMAVMNCIISYKSQTIADPRADLAEFKKIFAQLIDQPEETGVPLPREVLSLENLRNQLRFMLTSYALTWELQPHNEIPNFNGIKEFLTQRFIIMTDDIEHDSIFELE